MVIFDVSNDHAGRLMIFHPLLKSLKKSFPGVVALSPNHSAKLGIYVICTHVIVVQFFGTSGLLTLLNVHLVAVPVKDNVIVYVHGVLYVCVVSAVRFCTALPSHRSTVYAFAK